MNKIHHGLMSVIRRLVRQIHIWGNHITLALVTTLFLTSLAYAQTTFNLDENIHAILEQHNNIHTGVSVKNLETGETIYSHNANKTFVPASVLKLYTVASALWILGKDFQYTTAVYADSNTVEQGELKSDIHLVFSGDPLLERAHLNALIKGLTEQLGITQIKGNLILDVSSYDNILHGPGWMWDDAKFCFSAPVSALILNENCFVFNLSPVKKVGERALVRQRPQDNHVQIDSTITMAPKHTLCQLDLKVLDDNHYELSGCLLPNARSRDLLIAVKNPLLYGQQTVVELFKQANIAIEGDVLISHTNTSKDKIMLAEYRSLPLSEMVVPILKDSNNLIPNSLTKKMGEVVTESQGTWRKGVQAMQKGLSEKAGLDFNSVVIRDGSGSSRYNLISTSHLMTLLTAVYFDESINETLLNALAIVGVDGTARSFQLKHPAHRYVYVKTGTMTGVSGIAGYILVPEKPPLAFAILSNGLVGNKSQAKRMESNIMAALLSFTSL